jgi:Carboxypeptidase regulatory-like domain
VAFQLKSGLTILAFVALGWTSFGVGQAPQQPPAPGPEQEKASSAGQALPGQPLSGSISGTVVDQTGAVVAGARVRLTKDQPVNDQSLNDQSSSQEVISDHDGQFSFTNIGPGAFRLTITSAGFATKTFSGILHAGEVETIPPIALDVAEALTEVQVGVSQIEVAEEQIKVEEKQRVFGVIPNFYVSYVPNAAPLTSKQKFKLAFRTVVDPFTFVVVGGIAGAEQAQNQFSGYGQGAQGYGKRFGAAYADTLTGTFIGSAVLPSLLKQDPRYFYKGTGSKPSRFVYAIGNVLICKGDNGHWQANYSNILGSLAAGGLSNLYYPEQDRHGAGLTFENAAIGMGAGAIATVFQEFVVRKLTPKVPNRHPRKP